MDDRYHAAVSLGGGAARDADARHEPLRLGIEHRTRRVGTRAAPISTCAPSWRASASFTPTSSRRTAPSARLAQQGAAAVPKDDWLIVVAHHPADEIDVEDFLTPLLARGFDLYLNGHVHTLNQYTIDGGGSYVTSGAGAMVATQDQTTPAAEAKLRGGAWRAGAAADGHTYETVWNQKVAGFTLHTFSDDYQSLETQYIDYTGAVVHVHHKGGAPSPGRAVAVADAVELRRRARYPCTSGCTYVHKANAPQCGAPSTAARRCRRPVAVEASA